MYTLLKKMLILLLVFAISAAVGYSQTPPVITLNSPADGSSTAEHFMDLSATVTGEGPLKVWVFGDQTSGASDLLYFEDNVTSGATINYHWSGSVLNPESPYTMALWHFDDNGGTVVADESGHGNDGNLNNGPVWVSDGAFGYALDFDGDNDYMSIPDDTSLDVSSTGAITMEAWVYPHAIEAYYNTIMSKRALHGSSTNYQMSLDPSTGTLMYYASSGGIKTSTVTVPTDEWSYLAITLNTTDGNIIFYRNGVAGDTMTGGGIGTPNDDSLFIGLGYDTLYCFDGLIDEVRITKRALTAKEIAANYELHSGTYYWRVEAEDASALSSVSATRYFDQVPPLPPGLVNPPDEALINDNQPIFIWHTTPGAVRFTLQYAEDASFITGLVTVTDVTDTTYAVGGTLANKTYYWHVKPYNHVGDSGVYQPTPFSFTIDTAPPEIPELYEPAEDSYTNDNTPLFSWSATAGTGGTYLLEYTQDPAFTWVVSEPDLSGSSFTPTGALDDGLWYWRVEAVDEADNHSGFQTVPGTFTVDTEPPSIPTLLLPTEDFYTNDNEPEMVWEATAGEGGSYELQYSKDVTFTTGVETKTGLSDTAYVAPSSLSDGLWYWRVRAFDFLDNVSDFQTTPGSFTVDTEPPGVPVRYLPVNFSYIDTSNPQFVWSRTAGTNGTYILKCTDDYLFQEFDVEITDITDTTYTLTEPLADGTWLWAVYAVDRAGNQSGYQNPQRFTIDTEIPQIPTLQLPQNNCCINNAHPNFSWTSTAGSNGRYTIQYSMDNTFTTGVTTVEDLEFNNFSPDEPLTDGYWYWRVEAIDRVEHYSGFQPVPFSFRLDTQRPDVMVTAPPSGGTYTSLPSLTIFYEDETDLAQGSYQIDDCTGAWTLIWSGFTGTEITINWQIPAVSIGTHDIYLRVTDDGGNTNDDSCVVSWSFTYLPPCCTEYRGNVDCSEFEQPDISDITRLIDFLYLSHGPLCCLPEADCNASGGEPDISDITALIDHLYLSHKPLPLCP
jgi:hypothetical protein